MTHELGKLNSFICPDNDNILKRLLSVQKLEATSVKTNSGIHFNKI